MINYWLYRVDHWQPNRLIMVATILAMLLAGWMQYIQHGWINPDSVLYFEQAKRFVQGDYAGMLALFNWPLYGMLIGLVHQLTGFSLHLSAQSLNVIFFGLANFSFLHLIKVLGGSTRTLFFGAALLFSSQYIVGDVLEMLMRDEGFWAFFLTGIFFFVRFALLQKASDALLWQLFTIIAMLFRLEAITYLLLLPLLYLLTVGAPWRERLMDALQTYSISLFFGVSVLILFAKNPEIGMSHFGRLQEVFDSHFYTSLTQKLFDKTEIMADQVLEHYLREFALEGLLITFAFVLFTKSIMATGYLTSIFAFLGIKDKDSTITALGKRILLILLIIGLVTASLIVIKRFVLSKRYLISIVWVLLIFASFELSKLSNKLRAKQRLITIVMLIFMLLGFVKNILPKAEDYNYRQKAVGWLKSQNTFKTPVFYNDNRLIYFADAPFIGRWENNWEFLQNAYLNSELNQYDWLVITHNTKHPENLKFISSNLPAFKEVKRFADRKEKKFVIIYHRKAQQQ